MPSLIPNVESGKFSTSKKKIYSKITWIGTFCRVGKFSILIGKISTLVKIFHSSGLPSVPKFSPNEEIGKFSTLVENSPLPKICKKKFFCRIAWIGTFCRGRKISTFGGKFSTLVKFYFQHLDLRVCQISSPIEKLEFFPLLWKIFHLQKCAPKKKIFFAELHELEHSAEVDNFSILVENFPL